jgi:hypothetical protein
MLFKDKTTPMPKTLNELVDAALPDLAAKWDASNEVSVSVKASDYDKGGFYVPTAFWDAVENRLSLLGEPVTVRSGNYRDGGNTAFIIACDRKNAVS